MKKKHIGLTLIQAMVWAASPLWAQLLFVDKKVDEVDPGVTALRGSYVVAMSPDGKHLYAASALDNGLLAFSMDAFSGALTFVAAYVDGQGGVASLESCRGVAVSPDGKHVYAAALTDGAVTVFSRNSATGELALVEAIVNGGGVNGLGGAMSTAVSPDGDHVYVGSRSDDAVVAFSRNSVTGALTFIAFYQNLAFPIVGLDGVESITLSPDGAHLYAAAETDQALAAFSRDASTGELTFIEAYFDGANGVDGLGCVNDVAVSPDGDHVYATGQFGAPSQPFCTVGFDDWMAIFSRNPATGELTFVQSVSPDVFGLPVNCSGVASDNGVVVSPDGERVYATLQWRGAILELQRNAISGLVTLVSFDCADLINPDVIELLSAHRVTTDRFGQRVLVSALNGAVIVYETDAYNAFREGVADWPTNNIQDLLDLLDQTVP